MMRPKSYPFGLGLWLLPVAGLLACDGGDVSATGDTGGIVSVGGGNDNTGDEPTGTTEPADSTGAPTGPCFNGERDGDETDVDCGGPTCDPCGPGGRCESPGDCDTMSCGAGFCQTPTCYDGMQNGDEQGVDCGSICPNTCPGSECETDAQCGDAQFCFEGDCVPSSCDNQLRDTLESDVDCGGPDCPDCRPGRRCDADADCTTQVCGDSVCLEPTCDDGVLNGAETDADCGGPCGPCPSGGQCLVNDDCIEGICEDGTCFVSTCADFVLNGDETAIDCGGPQCNPCVPGQTCGEGSDCQFGVCIGGICLGAECDDMVFNGDETDVDCGGPCGATCVPGQDCAASADCLEGVCEFGQCSVPDCDDGVSNGDETDVDCGGPACGPTCATGDACELNSDCAAGVCNSNLCLPPECADGVVNGDETDVDCGGACGATCVPGQNCGGGDDCVQGVCVLGVCEPPACDDGVLNGAEGGVDCAGPCPQPCTFGGEQTVNTTLFDFQVRPAVAAAPNGSYFVVVWASSPVVGAPQDGDGAGIYARVYDAAGLPLTGEIQVNTTTLGDQNFPAVDASDDRFVVVWQGPDADETGIYAQRIDATGAFIGSELVLTTDASGQQRRPDVGLGPSGEFVACWESRLMVFTDIACRRFSAMGAPVGAEITANTALDDEQTLPVVEVAATGNFVVAWQSSAVEGGDGDGDGVFMRRFTAFGVPQSAVDEPVNEFFALDQQSPAIGMNPSGEFVIAWTSEDQDGSSAGVYARRYSSIGAALGGEFPVNTTTAGAQNNPAVALNPDGDFIIVWQTADDGVLTGVFGQRYDQDGAPFEPEFLVNPTVQGLQEEPDVAVRGLDEIIGVWSEGDAGFTNRDIRAQRYEALFP